VKTKLNPPTNAPSVVAKRRWAHGVNRAHERLGVSVKFLRAQCRVAVAARRGERHAHAARVLDVRGGLHHVLVVLPDGSLAIAVYRHRRDEIVTAYKAEDHRIVKSLPPSKLQQRVAAQPPT
jgi:hypothetical protein